MAVSACAQQPVTAWFIQLDNLNSTLLMLRASYQRLHACYNYNSVTISLFS